MSKDKREPLSPLAWDILEVLIEMRKKFPDSQRYLAGWHIANILNIEVFDAPTGENPGAMAIKELIDIGLVEELPDLRCRYQIIEKE